MVKMDAALTIFNGMAAVEMKQPRKPPQLAAGQGVTQITFLCRRACYRPQTGPNGRNRPVCGIRHSASPAFKDP
jgi:hypothetical protein